MELSEKEKQALYKFRFRNTKKGKFYSCGFAVAILALIFAGIMLLIVDLPSSIDGKYEDIQGNIVEVDNSTVSLNTYKMTETEDYGNTGIRIAIASLAAVLAASSVTFTFLGYRAEKNYLESFLD